MKRRSLLLGGLAGATGLGLMLRPTERGGDHAPYFSAASVALDRIGQSKPTLVVDRAKMLENVQTLKSHIAGRFDYRIVAKSLPSLPMLSAVMEASGSNRLMLFHQPFINQVAMEFPTTDILMGKPMPVAAAANFYQQHPEDGQFDTAKQLRWLLDTPQRVVQYDQLAGDISQTMSVCIELDVGLHRGGVQGDEQLIQMLDRITQSTRLNFSGFMGYEPHIVKVPGDPVEYRDRAMSVYSHFLDLAKSHLGDAWPRGAVLNCGGSPTYQMYDEGDYPFNELSAGSCLVKPSDFDLPSLADHRPASYIATPVLKSLETLEIPGINLGPIQSAWNPNRSRTFFTYGGYWKANPESPPGLSYNPLYGRSTNQDMFNGSDKINLKVDDWVFLRPNQSEFVFLQFGDIMVYEDGEIVDRWAVFSEQGA